MPRSLLIITIILVIVGIIIAVAVLRMAARPRRRDRRYVRNDAGQVMAIGSTAVHDGEEMRGRGAFTGEPTQLQEAKYVLDYELDVASRVAIVAEDGAEIPVLIAFGAGVKEFYVEAPGTYRWTIHPVEPDRPWRLAFHKVKGTEARRR